MKHPFGGQLIWSSFLPAHLDEFLVVIRGCIRYLRSIQSYLPLASFSPIYFEFFSIIIGATVYNFFGLRGDEGREGI